MANKSEPVYDSAKVAPQDPAIYQTNLKMMLPAFEAAVHASWSSLQWVVCRTKPTILLANLPYTNTKTTQTDIPFGAATYQIAKHQLPAALQNPGGTGMCPELSRRRERRTAYLGGNLVADLTKVTSMERGCEYELEIECSGSLHEVSGKEIESWLVKLVR